MAQQGELQSLAEKMLVDSMAAPSIYNVVMPPCANIKPAHLKFKGHKQNVTRQVVCTCDSRACSPHNVLDHQIRQCVQTPGDQVCVGYSSPDSVSGGVTNHFA